MHAKLRSLLDIRVAVVIFMIYFPWIESYCVLSFQLHVLEFLLTYLVVQVGGVHFSLLSKVRYDIGDSCSLDYLIDSIFPLFRKHIEPDLHHAQVWHPLSFHKKIGPHILHALGPFCRLGSTTVLFHHSEKQSTS